MRSKGRAGVEVKKNLRPTFLGSQIMNTIATGYVCSEKQPKIVSHDLLRWKKSARRAKRGLLSTSGLVPVGLAAVLFAPESEALSLNQQSFRELVDLNRLLYEVAGISQWSLDPETQAVSIVFEDGWRGIFEVGEYLIEGDRLFVWPENIYVQAYPVHAVWNLLWGHPGGAMAGGGLLWLMGHNSPPVAVADYLSFTEGEELGENAESLAFNVLGDDSDPNGDAISLVPFNEVTGDYGRFTMNGAGTDIVYHFLDDLNAANLLAGETDTDSARYTIQDEHGKTATATLTVTVTGINKDVTDGNEPGKGNPEGDLTEDDGSVQLTNFLANAEDVDGAEPVVDRIYIGDPANNILGELGEEVSGSNGGAFVVTANGAATFRTRDGYHNLAAGETVTSSIHYRVSDQRGSTKTSTATVTITGLNDAIVDDDEHHNTYDALRVTENSSITTGAINVLDNVTDPDDGDTKHVSVGTDKLTGSKTYSGSKGGTFTLTADGAMTFDPGTAFDKLAKDATTETSFTYDVTDGDTQNSSTVTVKVTGTNDDPEVEPDSRSLKEDGGKTTKAFDVLSNDSDVDGGTLELSGFANITKTYGTFALTASSADIEYQLANSSEAVQSLAKGQKVSETASYTIIDGQGGSNSDGKVTVTITGQNDNPTAEDFEETLNEGDGATTVTFDVMDKADDVDSDTTGLRIELVTPVSSSHGSFAQTTNKHKITYAFRDDDSLDDVDTGSTATDSVKYTVSDEHGGSVEKSITITINGVTDNTAPEAIDDNLTFTEDTSETKNFNVLSNDTDPEGDDKTVNTFTTKVGTYGTFSQTPTNGDIQYDFKDNEAAQKLADGATTTETATYSISDGSLNSNEATLTVKITGVNDAPVAGNLSGEISENDTEKFGMNAVDAASDVDVGDTITLKTLDDGKGDYGKFSIDGSNVAYQLTAKLDHLEDGKTVKDTATFTIKDEDDATDTATATVTITGKNDTPTVEKPANDIAIQDGQSADQMTFLVPKDGGGYEDNAGSGIGLDFVDVDDEDLTITLTGTENITGLAFTDNGAITAGTAKLKDHLIAETHTITITAEDDGDSDGSDPLSASDELKLFIGLNASKATGLEGETDYKFEGSPVAEDRIDTDDVKDFAMEGSEVTLNLGNGKNTFVNHLPVDSEQKLPEYGGTLNYNGGNGEDSVTMRIYSTSKGTTTIDLGNGENTVKMGDYAGSHGGTLTIKGGTGVDTVQLRGFAGYQSDGLEVHLGDDDSSADVVKLLGHVGASGSGSSGPKEGQVEIHDFDPELDEIIFKKPQNITGLSEKLVISDFNDFELVDADSDGNDDDILVETKNDLVDGKPPVKFYLVGDYTSASLSEFVFSTDGDDMILSGSDGLF